MNALTDVGIDLGTTAAQAVPSRLPEAS